MAIGKCPLGLNSYLCLHVGITWGDLKTTDLQAAFPGILI